ncbi:MAG TPA: lysophospholipid acyltransferase family protein [Chroococcales cyanobacterium]|jgi:1-acyl-sn-glycerol-3-phosphate acyltransferase
MPFVEKCRKTAQWLLYFAHTGLNFILLPGLKRFFFRTPWQELWKNFRAWAKNSDRLFGISIKLLNPEQVSLDRQYILVANHRSWFDQLVLAEALPQPIHFLAKKGYCAMPVFGRALTELVEVIPVENKKNKKLSTSVHRDLMRYLGRGDTVLFYVEGTRGSGKELLPFHPGAFKFAAKTGIPVLPLFLFGSEQVLSKHHSMLSVGGGEVVLRVEPPVFFTKEGFAGEMAAFEQEYRSKHDAWFDQFETAGLAPTQ